MKKSIPHYILGIALYSVGISLGLGLAVIATWSDVESSFYGFDRRASNPLSGLTCPILITKNETRLIRLTVKNDTDQALSPSIRTESSSALLPVSTLQSFDLAPGASKTITWVVGPENIDLERFIFFKVLMYASYPIQDRETTCGIFVIDFPLSGRVVLTLGALLGFVGIVGGLYTLKRVSAPGESLWLALRPMNFLGGITITAMLVSFLGWWIQSIVALVVAVLTLIVTIDYLMIARTSKIN